MNAIVPVTNAEVYRASTDAAGLCREIVLKTAQNIQGRKYVKVEGWQAIAIAHGCAASADHVERVNDEGMSGFRAIGIVRRMSDGAEIARAEGFLGDDEGMWAKRPVYARRAMVQTRAISRACRSAFAHVVVLIDANLSTTPAEEVPMEGFGEEPHGEPRNITPQVVGNGRLTAAEAKRQGLFQPMIDRIDGCETITDLDALYAAFDDLTREHPLSWLEPYKDRMEARREAIIQRDIGRPDYEAEFRDVVGPGPSSVAGREREVA